MVEKWLRAVTYFAVISLCFFRIHSYWHSYQVKPKPSTQSLAARLVGSRVGLSRDTGGGAAKETIVIAMTTSCVFCRASAPFYRKLLRKARSLQGSVRVLAVMPESKGSAVGYLQDSLLLTFDGVVQNLPGFATPFTPTLLVADEQGVVKGAWIGALKPAAEDEVMSALCSIAGLDRTQCRTP
jgi:thiol-disulfide isomerase/thioredoxin